MYSHALNIVNSVTIISPTNEHHYDTTVVSGFTWFHIQADAPDSKECLHYLGLKNEIIDALCTTETRPKAMQLGDGMLVYLRGINRNPDAAPEDMVSLRLWVSDNMVISARRKDRKLLSLQDVKQELENGTIPSSPMDLTLKIITKIADRISETVDVLDEELTEFEALDKSEKQDRIKLSMVRRQAAAIRRYLTPQRDALDAIYRFNKSLNQQQAFELRDQTDRMTRYVEDLELAKERAMVLQDELRNRIAEQQGMRMYVLSLVTAIFLPLSFLTGVFGMNVAGLPGTEEPNAFFYLAMAMLTVAIILLISMLWKKWF
ncbi:zinc transporter ZntB [Paraglaciecola psychrophila]|uniref:Mg2+ transporter protein, CorA-like protein n=1 Tax=Paraglaciecola psychrophila 170 TaxID=1129794 RepID=K7AYC6_9ALTE|nr:zinc transporter ZntB [Paraglaciecola psychrophila]AGH42892.1 Mg2+ transporter protein, CorA-like protein [Paraglaciecola psychrophila 170]GAC40095.1 metal ion transporter, MIT family [Paraglaciecola psychrophila 170]